MSDEQLASIKTQVGLGQTLSSVQVLQLLDYIERLKDNKVGSDAFAARRDWGTPVADDKKVIEQLQTELAKVKAAKGIK